jgi:uncharacterized protein YecT (DUF1311 family)
MKLILSFSLAAAGGIALAVGSAFAGPAAAANCASVTNITDHAICSNPAVAKADAAMTAAFEALIKPSSPPDQKVFRDSQSAWHDDRDSDCDYADATEKPAKPAAVAKCVIGESNERQRFLAGQPDEGQGATSAIVPVMREGQGFIWSFHFADPKTPAEKLLNTKLDGEVAGLHIGKTGADGNYVDPELKYASPTFVSVAVDGGHFSPSDKKDTPIAYNLNIDMQSGKLLTFADAFPDDALPQLQTKCMAQLGDFLKPEANGDTAIVAEDTKIAKTAVSDLSWWSFGAKQATIVMDPGDEDPYACHFDYAALSKIIKPGFPLPK